MSQNAVNRRRPHNPSNSIPTHSDLEHSEQDSAEDGNSPLGRRPVHGEQPEHIVVNPSLRRAHVDGEDLDINDALDKQLASTPPPREEPLPPLERPLNDDFENVLDSLSDPSENDVIKFPKYNIHKPPVSDSTQYYVQIHSKSIALKFHGVKI